MQHTKSKVLSTLGNRQDNKVGTNGRMTKSKKKPSVQLPSLSIQDFTIKKKQ